MRVRVCLLCIAFLPWWVINWTQTLLLVSETHVLNASYLLWRSWYFAWNFEDFWKKLYEKIISGYGFLVEGTFLLIRTAEICCVEFCCPNMPCVLRGSEKCLMLLPTKAKHSSLHISTKREKEKVEWQKKIAFSRWNWKFENMDKSVSSLFWTRSQNSSFVDTLSSLHWDQTNMSLFLFRVGWERNVSQCWQWFSRAIIPADLVRMVGDTGAKSQVADYVLFRSFRSNWSTGVLICKYWRRETLDPKTPNEAFTSSPRKVCRRSWILKKTSKQRTEQQDQRTWVGPFLAIWSKPIFFFFFGGGLSEFPISLRKA